MNALTLVIFTLRREMGWYDHQSSDENEHMCIYAHFDKAHEYIMFHIISMEELNVYLQQLSYIANHTIARTNNDVLDLF